MAHCNKPQAPATLDFSPHLIKTSALAVEGSAVFNSVSTSMYLLKKAIDLRQKSHPDHEKPFLEHLEDLRTMIVRIAVTLIVSMLVCFIFNKELMAFFRHPVDKLLATQISETLPQHAPHPLTVESWGKARKVEQAAMALAPEQRVLFYQSLADDDLAFQAKALSLYRAASLLPEAKRDAFVQLLPESADTKLQVKALLTSKPKTDTDTNGNLKMMSALKPTEGFMLSMKLSFVAGIVVSFPLLLMFVLQFVLPGMHSHEKRILWPAMTVGFGLFLAGTSFAYFLVLPRTLLFFAQWSGDMGISNDWRIGEYISFATQFTLLFGLAFELPVVVMVFVKLGLLTYDIMSKTRSYAIVAIFIAAAVLTPTPDMLTMTLMAAPMIILYEICIWLAYFDRKKARAVEEQEARESAERQLAMAAERLATEEAQAAEAQNWCAAADEAGDDGWDAEKPMLPPHEGELPPEIHGPPTL
jgi:sec-independent protein translocase protein TatC